MPEGNVIIRLKDACYAYTQDGALAVDHVSLEVREGEFLAVLGHNGSGKSTLAKLLNALFTATAGAVEVGGTPVADEDSAYEARRVCGMVFQNPDNQLVATIVEEDVAFGLENLAVPTEKIRARVDEALAMVGMSEFAGSAPHMLSGGQKQRIAIAGVLAMRPRVIVFDEATAMLDPAGRESVWKVVKRLNREEGITIVWITHFMEEAALADRLLVMDAGKIAMQGTPREVFSQGEKVRALGLDVPEMTEMDDRLRAAGIDLPEGILTVEEMVKALCAKREAGDAVPARPSQKPESFAPPERALPSAPVLEIKNLTHVYMPDSPFQAVAVRDVNLKIGEGELVGIIGHTGSGKSTLIQHFNGLLRPNEGSVIVDGMDLSDKSTDLKKVRQRVGMVFQYPEYQLFEETCYKDIAFGPKNMGLDEAEVDKRVHEAAEFVGLDEALLERSPFELSGGQKRRVAVAGVMAMKPRILVLDEPAAGLDPEGRDEILSEVKDYHKKTGTTVLLVSHSMEDIAKYADKVLVMSRKKIAMYDTVEKVFARAPELLELGLSVPQVTKIFLKLREMGVDVPADVYTIPYAVKMILAAKARRDAGETLVLPRDEDQKGGAAEC